jgi:hypothetical protein
LAKRRQYTEEDWKLYPWPEPKPGYKYGPTPMQEQLFIYHFKPWERPHFHTLDIVLLIGGASSGKCWQKGTPILLFDGTIKNVEDIRVGDLLMGPDSNPRKVTSLSTGRETMYRVEPRFGSAFVCNASHILCLEKSLRTPETRKRTNGTSYTKPNIRYPGEDQVNVSVLDYLKWSKTRKRAYKLYRSHVIKFPPGKGLPLDPYFLGIWLGDGHSRGPTVTTQDTEIIDYLKFFIQRYREPLYIKTIEGKCPSYAISSGSRTSVVNRPLKRLQELSLINNKHIPHSYKTASIKDRLDLLAGLLDTDGFYDKTKNTYEIIQKREILANDIVYVARSLGFASYVHPVKKSCMYKGERREGVYYRVSISGDLTQIPCKIPRKQAESRKRRTNQLHTGFSIHELPEDTFYGFTLEGVDRRHLLGDFTVVHNTSTTIAEIAELVASFANCVAIVGGANMPLLKRNVMDKFGDVFSWTGPDGVKYNWEHPMVLKPPPEKTPVAPLWNGSSIRFLNINDAEVVRGFTADVFAIEEVNLMEADSLKEMFRRSRGRALPIRQFILNMNPSGTRDWVYDMFLLKQFEPSYEGDPIPIGDPCTCEFCHVCLSQDLGQFRWEGGDKKIGPNGRFYEWTGASCSNPVCPTIQRTGKKQLKENSCPGNQYYYRVVKSSTMDNPHNPSDFIQLQKGALSAEEYATYVKGEIVDLRQGYIYKGFKESLNTRMVELDQDEDILWTHDFNKNPMCSVICQEADEGLNVVDEIVLWNADERDVAKAFIKKYPDFKNKVKIYGDPNGLNGSKADSKISSYKIMYDILKSHGYDVHVIPRKTKGKPFLIPIMDRVNSVRSLISTVDGVSRLFINPDTCKNLLESIRHVQWDDRVKRAIEDDRVDDNARNNPRRYSEPVLMTHPQAALGYLIAVEHPVFITKRGLRMLDSEAKSVIVEQGKLEVVEKERKPEVLPQRKVELPERAIDLGFDKSILKERLEYERRAAEEFERKQKEKRSRLDKILDESGLTLGENH